jgi:hypothetical protein
MSATGVRLIRSVTSPTAQMFSTVVLDHSSTAIAPTLSSCTPTFSSPMPACIRHAAGRIHHEVGLEHAAERRTKLVWRLAIGSHDALDLGLGAHPDTARLQGLVHEGAALLVEAAQDAVAPDHDIDLAAEPVEDAGKLDGDIATAHDRDALGQRIWQMERLVRGDGEFMPRNSAASRDGRRCRPGSSRR